MPDIISEEFLRYSRQMVLPQVGELGQTKLKAARILCVGAGGLGAPVLLYLAAAGVGTIGIADADTVDVTNLQRQILYQLQHIGQGKVHSAVTMLQALNPQLNYHEYAEAVTLPNAHDLLQDYDIIVDASDNFKTRYLLNDVCCALNKPLVQASVQQFQGQCSVFCVPGGPCYRCLFPEVPSAAIPNCAEAGVLGVVPGILGGIQATEVLKLILGIGESLIGRVLTFDALALKFNEFKLQAATDCMCVTDRGRITKVLAATETNHDLEELSVSAFKTTLQQTPDTILLDVREASEYMIGSIAGACHIPIGQLEQRLIELDLTKSIIVYCQQGIRSRAAAAILRAAGALKVYSLAGGYVRYHADSS